jgi:catechol 2,3-dioxygenase-like lactoylglutathione lyase family enzyme
VSARVHHSAIVVRDVDASLRFWRDGIGFQVLMDHSFDGDWRALFGAPAGRLRSVFLGDAAHADAGIVELVQFDGAAAVGPAAAPGSEPGFFLLSCWVDVGPVLARLAALGLGGEPDGVLVELIAVPAP